MLDQNKLLRRHALGSFDTMLREVTEGPGDAALALGHREHEGCAERELRARADGALHARRGQRLHRARRPRAGARADGLRQRLEARRRQRQLPLRPRTPRRAAASRSSASSGTFAWRDAVNLCLHHPKHAPFFVDKLWSYFIPVAPDAGTRRALEAMYRNGYEIRPVVDAILRHPALYTGPRMVKPPVVYTAGLLRGLGRGIDTTAWVWLASGTGQRLFIRRTSPAGTTSAGSTRPRSAGAGGSRTRRASRTRSTDKQAAEGARRAEGDRRSRDRVLGHPHAASGHARRALDVRDAGDGRRERANGSRRATAPASRTPSASCSPSPPTSRPA